VLLAITPITQFIINIYHRSSF